MYFCFCFFFFIRNRPESKVIGLCAHMVSFFSASYTLLLGSFHSNISDPILIFSLFNLYFVGVRHCTRIGNCIGGMCGPCIVHVYVWSRVLLVLHSSMEMVIAIKWTETIDRRALSYCWWFGQLLFENSKYYSSFIFLLLHSCCWFFFFILLHHRFTVLSTSVSECAVASEAL